MPPEAALQMQSEFAVFLEQNLKKELLRFTTAGSVDDGKSTLIGRLLHDSKSLYEDQLASVKKSRVNRSGGPIDFSLLTDGLRAEREQGITIDVGYRYFTTARRKFIIADTPGHEQYTRNMATGASTADLAVILVDGEKGLLPQTTRHAYIASLLGIPNVVAAINKMDLVGYREERFLALERDFLELAGRLGIAKVECIPISALAGDNVVERGVEMPWYEGPTLLEYLETVPVTRAANVRGIRFPVQYVIRPDATFRGFAGQVVGGVIRPGDAVVALPSGQRSRVESIVTFDGQLAEAFAPMSVTLKLDDEIDLSRGDMLVSPGSQPNVSRQFRATVVWMHAQPLETGRAYLIKQGARQVRGSATRIRHRVNINNLEAESAERLEMNDIAIVEFETSSPLLFDSYAENRVTGSFIVIDPLTNATLGAGMIQENLRRSREIPVTEVSLGTDARVSALERYRRQGHYPALVLTNAGTKLSRRIERTLFEEEFGVIVVEEKEAGAHAAGTILRAMQAAGFVVVYENSQFGSAERQELSEIAQGRLFDLSEVKPGDGQDEVLRQILTFAESLRISDNGENPGKVV